MAGNDNGGRALQGTAQAPTMLDDEDNLLDTRAPEPTRSTIERTAQRVYEQASIWVPRDAGVLDGPTAAVSVGAVVSLAQDLHDELAQFRGKPTMSQELLVNRALFALIGAATRLKPDDRLVVDALTANVGSLAAARGFKLAEPHPDSRVIETAGSPTARVAATQAAVVAQVYATIDQLAALKSVEAQEAAMTAATPRLVALLETLIAPPPGAKMVARESFADMRAALALLTDTAKHNRFDLVGSGLDSVLVAESSMFARFSLPAEDRRSSYYGPLNVSDFDEDTATRDDSLPSSSDLVHQVISMYEDAPLRQVLALTTLGPVLQEPPKPKDPSMFERVLEHIIVQALDVLSGTLAKGFSQAVRAIAANPGGAARAVGRGLAEGGAAVRDALPGPAQRGIDATGRAAKRVGKAVAPLVDAAVGLPPGALADLERAGRGVLMASGAKDLVAGQLASLQKEVFAGPRGDTKPGAPSGSQVMRFLSLMGSQIDAYATRVKQASPALRVFLEKLPPDQLTRLLDAQEATMASAYQDMRTTIAERWTTAIAAASAGLDEDGTTAYDWQHSKFLLEGTGAAQLRVRVEGVAGPMGTTMPKVTLLAPPVLNGISDSMKAVLAEQRQPLHTAHIHRLMTVEFPSSSAGAMLSMGTVEFGPDGQIDLSRADLYNLSSLALGQVPNRPYGEVEGVVMESMGRANAKDAERGARMVLESLGLTTADLR